MDSQTLLNYQQKTQMIYNITFNDGARAISDARKKFSHYAILHFMKDTPEGDAKAQQKAQNLLLSTKGDPK